MPCNICELDPDRYGIIARMNPDGSAQVATSDIVRALHLYRLACLIEGGLLLVAWIAARLTPFI